MRKILFLAIAALSILFSTSCEKKKVGYEKVFKNIYKDEQLAFEFFDPTNYNLYPLFSDGTLDSQLVATGSYQVKNDSIILNYFRGTIHKDKIVLISGFGGPKKEYIKIN